MTPAHVLGSLYLGRLDPPQRVRGPANAKEEVLQFQIGKWQREGSGCLTGRRIDHACAVMVLLALDLDVKIQITVGGHISASPVTFVRSLTDLETPHATDTNDSIARTNTRSKGSAASRPGCGSSFCVIRGEPD
jgi:hypothetical protein